MTKRLPASRQCGAKRQYPGRQAALADISRIDRQSGSAPGTTRPYKCPHCHFWHIGRLRQSGRGRLMGR